MAAEHGADNLVVGVESLHDVLGFRTTGERREPSKVTEEHRDPAAVGQEHGLLSGTQHRLRDLW